MKDYCKGCGKEIDETEYMQTKSLYCFDCLSISEKNKKQKYTGDKNV